MSDIDTVAVDSLKALDPDRPIREADMYVESLCPLWADSGRSEQKTASLGIGWKLGVSARLEIRRIGKTPSGHTS